MKSSRSSQPDGTPHAVPATEGGQPSDASDAASRAEGEATAAANGGAVLGALGAARDAKSLRRPDAAASRRISVTPGAPPGRLVAIRGKSALETFVTDAQELAEGDTSTSPARQLNVAAQALGPQLEALTAEQAAAVTAAIAGIASQLPYRQTGASAAGHAPRPAGSGRPNTFAPLLTSRAELDQLRKTAALLPRSAQGTLRGILARAEDRLTYAAIDHELENIQFENMADFARFVDSPRLPGVKAPMDGNTRAIFLTAAMAHAGRFGLARPMQAASVLRQAFDKLPDHVKITTRGSEFDAAHADLSIDQYTDNTLADFEAMIGTPDGGADPVLDQLQTDSARSRLLLALVRKLPQLDADTRPAVHEMILDRANTLSEPHDAEVADRLAEVEPRLLPDDTRASIAKSRALADRIMDAPEITPSTIDEFLADEALYGPDIPPDALGARQQDDGTLWVGRGPRPKPLATLAGRLADIDDRLARKTAGARLLEATKHRVSPERNQVPALMALAEASAQAGPELFDGVLDHASALFETNRIRAVDYRRILITLENVRLHASPDEALDTRSRLLAAKVKLAQRYPYMGQGL